MNSGTSTNYSWDDANKQCVYSSGGLYPVFNYDIDHASFNDYNTFFKYIEKIYVPTIYIEEWHDYDDDYKEKLIRETTQDIIFARNDYYTFNDFNNRMYYTVDPDGNVIAMVTSSEGFYGIDLDYVSNFIVGDSSGALSWKQGHDPWGPMWLGGADGGTMKSQGCLATSVAKLIMLSGTQINAETFDPKTFITHAGFTPGGGLKYNSWSSIAPNFKRLEGWIDVAIPASSSNVSGVVNSAIKNKQFCHGGSCEGDQYYYIIYVRYNGGSRQHYIPIVGSDANGFIVSDPAYGGNTYYLNDIGKEIMPDVTILAIEVYEKMD